MFGLMLANVPHRYPNPNYTDANFVILEAADTPADYPSRIQFTDDTGAPVEWVLSADH